MNAGQGGQQLQEVGYVECAHGLVSRAMGCSGLIVADSACYDKAREEGLGEGLEVVGVSMNVFLPTLDTLDTYRPVMSPAHYVYLYQVYQVFLRIRSVKPICRHMSTGSVWVMYQSSTHIPRISNGFRERIDTP